MLARSAPQYTQAAVRRPREADAGRVMIPVRCRSSVFVTTRIAWVKQSRRSIGKDVGLRIAGRKAGHTHPVVLEVCKRSFSVIPDTIGQRQRTRHFPVILRVRIVLPCPDIDQRTGSLIEGCRDAKQEVSGWVARTIGSASIEVEVSAVGAVKGITKNKALQVCAEFQTVVAGDLAEVVEISVIFIFARLRPIGAEPESEVPIHVDQRQGPNGWILRDDVEPER